MSETSRQMTSRRPRLITAQTSAGREGGDGGAGDLHFAGLVRQGDVEVDEALAVFLALAGDGDLRGQLLTGPRLLREPHLEVAQVADAHPVGDRAAEQSHREHAVTEHARKAGFL